MAELHIACCTLRGDIKCILREPTATELQEFRAARQRIGKGRARVAFFDLLVVSVENEALLKSLPEGFGTGRYPQLPDPWKIAAVHDTFETPAGFKLLKLIRGGNKEAFIGGVLHTR